MNTLQLYRGSLPYHRMIRLGLGPAVLLLCAAIAWIAGAAGSLTNVVSHVLFVPILLAALVHGIPGGMLFALASSIVISPYLPFRATDALHRDLLGWLCQVAAFALIGGLGGLASDAMREHLLRIRRLARLDPATGLPNARALLAALEKLAQSRGREESHLLGVVTVYNSDEMSSAFGFGVMDDCMRKLAACGADCLPRGGSVFRIGTEQIGLLAPCVTQAMPILLARLNSAFRQPLNHEEQPIHADARIGYVAINGFVEAPESFLRKAQAASLQASQSGHDVERYRIGIRSRARDNLIILGELIGGMEREEVMLYYQPKVSLSTGAVIGVEALIRWQHPERGLLPPGVFIPRAEQSTLIHTLTEFALERALRQAVVWRDAGMPIPIAVNVSPRNLMQPGLCNIVLRALERNGAGSELLELEVTEGAMVGDIDLVVAELHQLAEHGVGIAIDDFGTGYCSINYLDRLPASILKIDQSFIRRLQSEESSVDIVDAVVSVAHKKGVHIVAEGVESQEVFDMLLKLGCDVAQGYAIGKPMPAAQFEHWYRDWHSREQPHRTLSRGAAVLAAPVRIP